MTPTPPMALHFFFFYKARWNLCYQAVSGRIHQTAHVVSQSAIVCHAYGWLALHHLACANVAFMRSFLSAGSCIWLLLKNEWGQLSFTVFLRLCACGLCGLSHSEEPCGDIFGDGWVESGPTQNRWQTQAVRSKGCFPTGRKPGWTWTMKGGWAREKAGNSYTEMHMHVFN